MDNKNIEHESPFLSFEFASSKGEIEPFTFRKPLKLIVAHTIEEVVPCFQLIEEAIQKGYYAAGYVSYESAPAFDASFMVKGKNTMPLVWFGIFSEPEHKSLFSTGSYTLTEWLPSVSIDEYKASILSIKESIKNGNTYQTNYTIRLESKFEGDDIAYFHKLKRAQASNYCAYIHTGEHSILSVSPELFFHRDGEQLTTRPMKGTIKRGNTLEEDEELARWLYLSEKNRAENVMIVDLLRNDLGMIAEPASVHVPKLFEIEHYPTVHQMTSTITAKIPESTPIVDIFKALFPCGSITGAPKISTMNIIANLETAPREVYCGAIGFIAPNKEAIFNVPIRTVVINHKTGKATYGVGGGITWDSTSEDEYHEVLAKKSVLEEHRPEFQLLESFLLSEGEIFLTKEHLCRLEKSAKYFDFPIDLERVENMLSECTQKHACGEFKLRLLLMKNGEITLETQPIKKLETPLKVILAEEPLDKNNPFLYHKTTNRDIYTHFQKKYSHVFDCLLWNIAGELTEFTNGNVVLDIDGKLWTPPVSSGLLAGTFRESLIREGIIHEKTLTVADLKRCRKSWFINSVRKWVDVVFVLKKK